MSNQRVLAVNSAIFHVAAMVNCPSKDTPILVKPEQMPEGYKGSFSDVLASVGPAFHERVKIKADPQYRKVLPYWTILRGNEVLMYDRTKSGDQESLWERISIGYGGHIEPVDRHPPEFYAAPNALNLDLQMRNLILEGSLRELREELNKDLQPEQITKGLESFKGYLLATASQYGLTELEYVGLSFVLHVDADFEPNADEAACQGHRWVNFEKLYSTNMFNKLEPWSKAVILNLVGREGYGRK